MKFGVGVIGATGYIGTPYCAEIRECTEDARIVALCARRMDRLREVAREHSAQLYTSQWQEVVEHPDVNLVLVLTPDALHFPPVMAAASLGKHVFCEKPVARNAAEGQAMWNAVRDAHVAHYVPFWTRYVPIFRRAKEIVSSGRLGQIRTFVYRWHNPRPISMPFTWRDDAEHSAAGSIADVGSHAYDALRFILGREALRVLAHTKVVMPAKPDLGPIDLTEAIDWGRAHRAEGVADRRRGTAPDFGQVIVEMGDGLVGCLLVSHASYVRRGFAPELELHGIDGSLAIDRVRGELLFADSPDPAKRLESIDDEGASNRFLSQVFPALREQLSSGHSAHPNLLDGLKVQQFTDAVVDSAQSGGWVKLPETKDDER